MRALARRQWRLRGIQIPSKMKLRKCWIEQPNVGKIEEIRFNILVNASNFNSAHQHAHWYWGSMMSDHQRTNRIRYSISISRQKDIEILKDVPIFPHSYQYSIPCSQPCGHMGGISKREVGRFILSRTVRPTWLWKENLLEMKSSRAVKENFLLNRHV